MHWKVSNASKEYSSGNVFSGKRKRKEDNMNKIEIK